MLSRGLVLKLGGYTLGSVTLWPAFSFLRGATIKKPLINSCRSPSSSLPSLSLRVMTRQTLDNCPLPFRWVPKVFTLANFLAFPSTFLYFRRVEGHFFD
jgi:hypothetical protein